MKTETFDVLVCGLGPAGSRAAWAAARRGARVLAIDRRHRIGSPVQCAELVPALLHQEAAALAHAVAQPIAAMHTYVDDEACDVTPDFPGAMIDRAAFDSALAKAARDAGAQCSCGVALVALAPDGIAHLSDGRAIQAQVVIGADGPRSRIGRAVGRVNRDLTEARQVTVALHTPHFATDIFLSHSTPGGYAWLFPKGSVAHIGAGVMSAESRRLPAIVAALHQRLAAQGRVGRDVLCRTGGAIPGGGLLDPVAKLNDAHVLLAGDAAGLANPVTGAGIAAAVQSGAMAGEAAADRLQGKARALEDYRTDVQALFGPALERAVQRRRTLLDAHRTRRLTRAAQRRGWIAYPEYWAA